MNNAAAKTIEAITGKPANNGAVAPKRMALANLISGKLVRPMRVLLYGVPKIGKTTWAAGAPKPIFLCCEDGTANLNVERFPEPHNFAEVLDAIDVLANEPHSYLTLAIDTCDWLEPLIYAKVLEDAGKTGQGIESLGFGKGYVAAVDLWRILLSKLDALRTKRNMHIIMLGHAHIKPYRNPTGDDFDKFGLKMNEKGAGVITEWCDAVLFATFEVLTYKADKLGKAKGVGDGARVVYTSPRDAFTAGNRFNLPPELPLAWNDFWEAVQTGTADRSAKMRADIETLIPLLPEKTVARVRETLATAGDNEEKLAQLLDWATAKTNG